jgi:hypothetical protein
MFIVYLVLLELWAQREVLVNVELHKVRINIGIHNV